MNRILTVLLLLSTMAYGQTRSKGKAQSLSKVPALDELASDWMNVATLRNFPSVMNFIGGLQTTENLTGFQNLTFPPYAQGGSQQYSWDFGLNSPSLPDDKKEPGECALLLDGKPVIASYSRWLPYEVQRKTVINNVELSSFIRLPFEQKGVLEELVLRNKSSKNQRLTLSLKCHGRVRSYPSESWRTWGNERPIDTGFILPSAADFQAGERKGFVVQDRTSQAVTGFSFGTLPDTFLASGNKNELQWNIVLAPGETKRVEWACVIGDNAKAVTSLADSWTANFKEEFDAAKIKWEERWQASFVPGNKHFSGHFPTLITSDPKIRRVYYMGVLTPLLLCRTNLPLNPRCFVTAGPQWANTLTYFWDAEMWANTWAMLEPTGIREQLVKWLSMDIHRCYAVDDLSGGSAGPWYAANDWSVFRCVEAYLAVTGDSSFLQRRVDDKSVLEHLQALATFYETRPLTKELPLGNYGGAENLLECSPSYIEGVPSLNAANVYMLRKTAAYFQQLGNNERATELRAKATKLLPFVMSLYAPGEGVWNALDTAGNKVPIRHCFDYIVTGQALENDLSKKTKLEMNHFVQSELLTKTWMRAMSLKDPAAAKSDRPDHGPMGSYDAWPPMTMDVMCRFGDFSRALTFLRATEEITHQGPWTQSHEFIGPDSRGYNPIVRIASRGGQDANEGCGTAFAEVIIRSFFGFRPDLSGDTPVLLLPKMARGMEGTLKHVSWKNRLYTVVSNAKGVHMMAE